jgi:peptide/nickel transport system permease protein
MNPETRLGWRAARPGWLGGSSTTAVGLGLIGFWVAAAIFAPILAPYAPTEIGTDRLAPPSGSFVFGTDDLGRDVLSRVLWGGRISIPLPLLLVSVSVAIGGLLGGVAGFFGGLLDEVIMRLTDLFFAFPTIVLAMAIVAALGPGLENAVIALIVVFWPSYARVTRAMVRTINESEYVVANRLLGASFIRSFVFDVLPNIAGPILILAALDLGSAVLLISGLSFLGLGAQPPLPEWGAMITTGTLYVSSWWIALFPGLAIFTTVLGFNLLGDSLRDRFDPRIARFGN